MIRLICTAVCVFTGTFLSALESSPEQVNFCEKAINQKTGYRVSGIYGSSLELEHNPSLEYVLLREMQRFKVLYSKFQQKTDEWRFEFVEMIGGKMVVFVYHRQIMKDFCAGPNTFFVLKK